MMVHARDVLEVLLVRCAVSKENDDKEKGGGELGRRSKSDIEDQADVPDGGAGQVLEYGDEI